MPLARVHGRHWGRPEQWPFDAPPSTPTFLQIVTLPMSLGASSLVRFVRWRLRNFDVRRSLRDAWAHSRPRARQGRPPRRSNAVVRSIYHPDNWPTLVEFLEGAQRKLPTMFAYLDQLQRECPKQTLCHGYVPLAFDVVGSTRLLTFVRARVCSCVLMLVRCAQRCAPRQLRLLRRHR